MIASLTSHQPLETTLLPVEKTEIPFLVIRTSVCVKPKCDVMAIHIP
jgi:hypothetical protein